MALQLSFLRESDLKTHAFWALVAPSIADHEVGVTSIEAQNIAIIRSKLKARYDVDAIFSIEPPEEEDEDERNPLIVRVLTKLVLYDIFRRNAARKIPEDIKEEYKWAMQWLDNVNAGIEQPDLPPVTDDNGNPIPILIYGNNRNDNFYI